MQEQNEIIEMMRASAEEYVATQTVAQVRGRAIEAPTLIDRAQWAQIADMGWLGLNLPEMLGGTGLGAHAAATLCEVFGRHLYAQPYIGAALLPAQLLAQAHAHPLQAQWCDELISGRVPFVVAWQEAAADFSIRAEGVRLEQGILNGCKRFVVAVEEDAVLLVSAAGNNRTVLVAVQANAPGVSILRFATAQGNLCEVHFKDVLPVHQQALIEGAECDAALQGMLALGRVAASAQLAGLARGCLDKTIQYVSQRVQFGRAMGSFQSVAHRCVDQHLGVQLATVAWQDAARVLEGGADDGTAQFKVCAAKARCTDVALEMGRLGVQLHGAMGFTEEADIGMYLRGAMQYGSWLGGSRELRRQFLPAFLNTHHPAEAAHG
jgi:alkylation response protein AidB-like acyl-CoA dehydrogenase